MIYTELVTVILGVSLVFYTILGGADFGAGILEIFTGDRANQTISKAMAPVWEANHIWLIIAVVILFNGFPAAYAVISTALHLPIMLSLVGIILRGSVFTFRHYDAYQDGSQKWYSAIFRYSSLFTVLMLGITVGALVGGTIPATLEGSFYDYFMAPWLNLFCISVGIFVTILSAYIASLFLLGEVETEEGYGIIQRFAKRLFVASVGSGLLLFFASYYQDLQFHHLFFQHPVSLVCGVAATVLIPLIFRLMEQKQIWTLRFLGGLQILLILCGWFFVQWPDLIKYADGSTLSIYTATAPLSTMKILAACLVIGVLIIFPALYYLFRVFKMKTVGSPEFFDKG